MRGELESSQGRSESGMVYDLLHGLRDPLHARRDIRVIGTDSRLLLSRHRLWNEPEPKSLPPIELALRAKTHRVPTLNAPPI